MCSACWQSKKKFIVLIISLALSLSLTHTHSLCLPPSPTLTSHSLLQTYRGAGWGFAPDADVEEVLEMEGNVPITVEFKARDITGTGNICTMRLKAADKEVRTMYCYGVVIVIMM